MWIKVLFGTTALTVVGAMPLAAQDSPDMNGLQLAQYGGYSPQPYGGPPYGGYNQPYYNQAPQDYQQQQPGYQQQQPGPQQYGSMQPGPQQYGQQPGPQQYGAYAPQPGGQPGYGPDQQGIPGGGQQQYNVAGAPPYGGQHPGGQPGGYGPGQQGIPPSGQPGYGPDQQGNQPGGQQPYNVAGVPQYGGPPPQGSQQQPMGTPSSGQNYEATQTDVTVFTEATVAALKASLKLTADQEKLWGPFEVAARDLAKVRTERAAQLREEEPKPQVASGAPPQASSAPRPAGAPATGTPAATPAVATAPKPDDVGISEGLLREADALSKHAAALMKFADAVGPLYKSLDDSQKQRFVAGAAPILPQNPPFHF